MQSLFPLGRRSLLFGVHQFLWHPWTVYRAWNHLYGRPDWREVVCIFLHDWGYWFCENMDGKEGRVHPEFGAKIAAHLLGREYGDLVLYHSRYYSNLHCQIPSKLCWADKLSIVYDPKWFYLLRAKLSGEIKEYRLYEKDKQILDLTDGEWFDYLREEFLNIAEVNGRNLVSYHGEREVRKS
ncbi:hypothetical protein [Paenibacillus silvae]|uniref:hypothetical protein n=1 Tax=Paenibacillus silvae TaxID=1325358 RepID=UPI0020063B3B